MEKSLLAIGQAGAETLEAFAAGLREKYPAEAFIKQLVQVRMDWLVDAFVRLLEDLLSSRAFSSIIQLCKGHLRDDSRPRTLGFLVATSK